jgi:Holliday junction resolvasome RuvABC endonuclease subunit
MGIKIFEAHLQQVKKAIGGHGRAAKTDMIAAVRRYGYDVTEENEADAIAVRLYSIMTRHKHLMRDFNLDIGALGAA